MQSPTNNVSWQSWTQKWGDWNSWRQNATDRVSGATNFNGPIGATSHALQLAARTALVKFSFQPLAAAAAKRR
jgi:hypothetical protein